MKVQIKVGKSEPFSLEFNGKSNKEIVVKDLENAISKSRKRISVERQRIKFNGKVLKQGGGETLAYYEINDGDLLEVKDLGPQIGWRTVFFIEYLGPLLIHPFYFYFVAPYLYGPKFEPSLVQKTTMWLIVLHFLKREYETAFVHKFSKATMPFFNVFKNSFHYHFLSGLLIAVNVYTPSYSVVQPNSLYYLGCALYLFGQVSNFSTHVTLSNLRPPGTTVRKIPFGYGFGLLSCPNYFFETLAWIGIAVITNNWSIWLFLSVAFTQMAIWALNKHKAYKKDFPTYPKERKAIIPFLV